MPNTAIFPGAIRGCLKLVSCLNPEVKVREQRWNVECMSCHSQHVRAASHLANATPAQYGCSVCLAFAKALRFVR